MRYAFTKRAAMMLVIGAIVGCSSGSGEVASSSTASALVAQRIHQTTSGRFVRDLCDHSANRFCLAELLLPEDWQPGDMPLPEAKSASSAATSMQPADVLGAYKIPATAKANGAIVAILDSPDSFAAADLAAYRAKFGLPPLPTCKTGHGGAGATPCFSQVNQQGGRSSGADSGLADGETSLDMDMISAACTDCSILLVELDQLTDGDILAGAQTAARLGAVATSISLGGPENGGRGSGADPTGYTKPGHLVLAASGDFGFDLVNQGGHGASYPASAPDVLAVGGTNLFLKSGNPGTGVYDEAVWNDGTFGNVQFNPAAQDVTTSGCSLEFAMPVQQVAAVGGACGKGNAALRATADLSAAATFTSGGVERAIGIVCTAFAQQGGSSFAEVEGTSASSPLMAALLTRIGLAVPISQNLGLIYSPAALAAFNDLGSSSYPVDPRGSNTDAQRGCRPASLCTAGPGWDGPSGVGTPNATKLAALAPPTK
jgi:subtilase family serine protease